MAVITYRSDKGAPLTIEEIDNNFHALEDAISGLAGSPATAVGISNIAINGGVVIFYLTDGSSFGPFPLPYVSMHIRTDFDSTVAQSYQFLDLVPVPNVGLFLAKTDIAYEIGDPFSPDAVDTNGDPVYVKVFGQDTTAGGNEYEVALSITGIPGGDAAVDDEFLGHVFTKEVYFPEGLTGSTARLLAATTDELVFTVTTEDADIATLTFPSGSDAGAFTAIGTGATQRGAHGYISLVKTAADDATAKGLMVSIVGTPGTIPV